MSKVKLILVKSGTIEIRIDKDKFDSILNSLKGIGDVLSWNINGQDVTDKFVDIESRLRTLRLEQTKIEEYLKKANDLDQLFKIESRLTEIRTEIEGLTGNLKQMTDLVQLSTITINMSEKFVDLVQPDSEKPYFQRLWDNLIGSLKGVYKFLRRIGYIYNRSASNIYFNWSFRITWVFDI